MAYATWTKTKFKEKIFGTLGYECSREEKQANLKKFLGNFKVHFKTKSAPMLTHLNLSLMFLNCLLLDLAVKLTSCPGRPHILNADFQGEGVYSDFGHPRTRGEGGQKRANFRGHPLWRAPK